MATITITPGNSFNPTETVTSTKLNDLGSPTAALTAASIGTADIAAGAVTPAKLSTGAPSWDASSHLIVTGNITNNNDTGSTVIYGGTQGNGAHIELYSGSHPTAANKAYYDATEHNFRQLSGTQLIRIDSSGNLLVGTTDQNPDDNGAAPGIAFHGSDSGQAGLISSARVDNAAGLFNRIGTNGTVVGFRRSGVGVGGISVTQSATAYNTSSDYRLKEDITSIDNSIERLKQLKPCNFAWKSDGTRVDGFIAHEAQEVVPNAATGTKDAVNEDGTPDYQGIDQSKLIPLLTKALQEAVSKIEALESRVATIES